MTEPASTADYEIRAERGMPEREPSGVDIAADVLRTSVEKLNAIVNELRWPRRSISSGRCSGRCPTSSPDSTSMTADAPVPSAPHLLHVTYQAGAWLVSVTCPNEAMGDKRPCAVWGDADATTRIDECTFQQYSDALDYEDWLHGPLRFAPVPIVEGGSGEDWHA